MSIALDFDDTYTADEELWESFVERCKERGHACWIVTARADNEMNRSDVRDYVRGIPEHRWVFCGMSPKRWFCEQREIRIDVWIDDLPESVTVGR